MSKRLDDWDNNIAPKLSGIRREAAWIEGCASSIKDYVEMLPSRPAWTTMGESNLAEAIETLREALAVLEEAQERYRNKETCA